MENKKKGLNLRAIIPLATAIVSLVFIVVGLKDYGFWKAQPTPGFFPIIIAVVLGALLLAGLYALFGDVVMPTLNQRIKDMFNYAGALGG